MVRLALSAQGYMVLDATGAAELAALCQNLGEEQIDLLIIDHGLKPDNGRVIAENLVKVTPVPKVLIISGSIFNTVQDEDGIPPGSLLATEAIHATATPLHCRKPTLSEYAVAFFFKLHVMDHCIVLRRDDVRE